MGIKILKGVVSKDIYKAIAASSGVIERAIINRPIIIPTSKDTTGYIKKTPTLNERIIFE